ncbi:MAG: hypothetical protein LBV15_04885, partial [Planctomycetota bacterium]|nr:hypothetical protein [Planctomycetota bacterium]
YDLLKFYYAGAKVAAKEWGGTVGEVLDRLNLRVKWAEQVQALKDMEALRLKAEEGEEGEATEAEVAETAEAVPETPTPIAPAEASGEAGDGAEEAPGQTSPAPRPPPNAVIPAPRTSAVSPTGSLPESRGEPGLRDGGDAAKAGELDSGKPHAGIQRTFGEMV